MTELDHVSLELTASQALTLGDLADCVNWWRDVADEQTRAEIGVSLALIASDTSEDSADPEDSAAAEDIAAAAVCAALLGKDAATVTALRFNAAGQLDHGQWMDDCERVRDLAAVLSPLRGNIEEFFQACPWSVRHKVIAIADCFSQSQPALLDGSIVSAALLVAYELDGTVLRWVRSLQRGTSPAEHLSSDYLGVPPILRLSTRVANGSLAPLAVDTINSAVAAASKLDLPAASPGT